MNDTLLRQWAMLNYIPRYPRKVDVATLAARLFAAGYEISKRSIQRDLITLSQVVPLVSDDAKPQGWSWKADAAQLELPTLEPQAALTFQLVERYMQSLLPSSTLAYLQPWFKTARAVLNQHDTSIASWPDKVRVLPRGVQLLAPVIDEQVQAVIYQCLSENKRARITYLPRASKEVKEYMITPLALVVRDKLIYLLCTMKEYANIRQLALHRIKTAEITEKEINRPTDFDVDTYIASGAFGILDVVTTMKLVVNFNVDAIAHLTETPISSDQKIEEKEGGIYTLTATVPDNLEICWWLLAFGDQVEVIKPAKLRRKIKNIAQSMCRRYERDDVKLSVRS